MIITNIKNHLFRHKFILGLFLLSLISVVYLTTQLKKTPNTPVQPASDNIPLPTTNSQYQKYPLQKISYSPNIVFPDIPTTLSSHKAEEIPLSLNSLAQKISEFYKLPQNKNAPDIWNTETGYQYVLLDRLNQIVTYQLDSNQKPEFFTGNKNPSVNESIQSATQFLEKLGILSNYSTSPQDTKFFLFGTSHIEPIDQRGGNLVEINFTPKLNSLPIYKDSFYHPAVSILVGQNNTVVKAQISPLNISVSEPIRDYYLLNKDELLINLNSFPPQIIEAPINILISYKLEKYPEITINETSLEYRYNSVSKKLTPYYRLVGTFITNDKQKHSATFITPAVKI